MFYGGQKYDVEKGVKPQLAKMFNYVFFGVFYYLFILAVGTMNLQSPLSAIAIVPLSILLIYVIKSKKVSIRPSAKMWHVLWGVSMIVMLAAAFQLEVDLSWDWGGLIKEAYNYTMTGELAQREYFIRYPQQQFWLSCLILLFKVVAECTASTNIVVFKVTSMVVSVLLVQITIYFIYKTAKLVWNEEKAFWAGLAAVLYAPFYLYAMFLYNDTPGACAAILLIYCYLKIYREERVAKKLLFAAILGALGALILQIKILTFIVFLAVVIDAVLKNRVKQMIPLGALAVAVLMGSYMLLDVPSSHILDVKEDEADRWECPNTHYIMMMLNLNTQGGYNADDVAYTWKFHTYEKRKEANIQEIKNRLAQRGKIGTVKHILYTKQVRTWTNSCLGGDDYVSRTAIRENSLCEKLFSMKSKWHWIGLLYTWVVHIMIFIGLLLSTALSFRQKVVEQNMLVGRIAVFGVFLFLSIWECNSRYLFTLTPIMILVAADGFFMLYDRIVKRET